MCWWNILKNDVLNFLFISLLHNHMQIPNIAVRFLWKGPIAHPDSYREVSGPVCSNVFFGPIAQLVSSTWLIIRGSLVRAQLGPPSKSKSYNCKNCNSFFMRQVYARFWTKMRFLTEEIERNFCLEINKRPFFGILTLNFSQLIFILFGKVFGKLKYS